MVNNPNQQSGDNTTNPAIDAAVPADSNVTNAPVDQTVVDNLTWSWLDAWLPSSGTPSWGLWEQPAPIIPSTEPLPSAVEQATIPTPTPATEPTPVEPVAPVAPVDMTVFNDNVARSFTGELQRLANQGITLDEAVRSQVLETLGRRFQNMAEPQQVADAILWAEQKAMQVWWVSNFQALADKFNQTAQKVTTLNNTPNTNLAQSLANGIMSQGDLEAMRLGNPDKYNEVIRERNEILANRAANDALNWEWVTALPEVPITDTSLDNFYARNSIDPSKVDSFLWWNINAFEMYNAVINTGNIDDFKKQLLAKQNEATRIQWELNKIKGNIEKQFPGMSTQTQALLARDRAEPLQLDLLTLQWEITNIWEAINSEIDNWEAKFQILLDERQRIDAIEWANLERQDKLNRDMRDNRVEYISDNLTSEERTYYNNLSLWDKNTLSKLVPAAVKDLVNEMMGLWDNVVVTPLSDGTYQLTDIITGASKIHSPALYSTTSIWTSKLRAWFNNTRDSIGTSAWVITPFSETFWWFKSVGKNFTEIWGELESKDWWFVSWIDIDLEIWDSITAPTGWTITDVQRHRDGNLALTLTTDDWVELFFNHLSWTAWPFEALLDPMDAKGRKVTAGDLIAFGGNSWSVVPLGWWDWSHLDIYWKYNGTLMKLPDLAEYLTSGALPWQEVNSVVNNANSFWATDFTSAWLASLGINFYENLKQPTNAVLDQYWGMQQFTIDAGIAYLEAKNREFDKLWFNIQDPQTFMNIPGGRKAEVTEALTTSMSFLKDLRDIRNIVNKEWLPRQNVQGIWAQLNSKYYSSLMKLKEYYDLWVLNWPDLDIMEKIIPQITSRWDAKTTKEDALSQMNALLKSFDESLDLDTNAIGLWRNPVTGPWSLTPEQVYLSRILPWYNPNTVSTDSEAKAFQIDQLLKQQWFIK